MLLPLSRSRPAARTVAALALVMAASAVSAESADFEVREGYLSASVRELVDSHEWSLVWSAGEDRVISHPFTIANDSLQGALESLLLMYGGQFVADLYRGNRVVVVNTPPPQVDVTLPDAEGTNLAQQSTGVGSSTVGPDLDFETDDRGITTSLAAAYELAGSNSTDGTISPTASNESEEVAIESP